MVELRKLVHVFPDLLIRGVENMRTIFVYMDPLNVLTINISRDVVPPVDHKTLFPSLMKLVRHDCTIQSGSDNQIVILHNASPYIFAIFIPYYSKYLSNRLRF